MILEEPISKLGMKISKKVKEYLPVGAGNWGMTQIEYTEFAKKINLAYSKGIKISLSEQETKNLKAAIAVEICSTKHALAIKKMKEHENIIDLDINQEDIKKIFSLLKDPNNLLSTLQYNLVVKFLVAIEQKEGYLNQEEVGQLLQIPTISEIFNAKKKKYIEDPISFISSYLSSAEDALKYGGSLCEGFASVSLYLLLQNKKELSSIKNIVLCTIDKAHIFIVVNCNEENLEQGQMLDLDKNKNSYVIDPYNDVTQNLEFALNNKSWQCYQGKKIECAFFISNPSAIVNNKTLKTALAKVTKAYENRKQGLVQLNIAVRKIESCLTNNLSNSKKLIFN